MLKFIKKYELSTITITNAVIHIQNKESSYICFFDVESSQLRINDALSLSFVKELIEVLEELVK